MPSILEKLRLSQGGKYQQINNEEPTEKLPHVADTPDEHQPLVSQSNFYASLTDPLDAAEKALEKKQLTLKLFMSGAATVFTQINTELDDSSTALLYAMLDKESLINAIETALEFKLNYESWLKTFCTTAVFTAILHTMHAITLEATLKEKDVKPNELNNAVNKMIAATIDHTGKTLESWGVSNDDINRVKQHLSAFKAEKFKRTWSPQPPISISDLNNAVETLNDKLKELEPQCTALENIQKQFNERYPNLKPQQDLSATLQQREIASSLSTKQSVSENGNDKISSLDDLLSNLIEQYLMACEGKAAFQKLEVIKHVLEIGAILPKDFALNPTTPGSAQIFALLGTLLRHLRNKTSLNNANSNKLELIEPLLTLCDAEFENAMRRAATRPQDAHQTNRRWSLSIFSKSKQRNDDLNSRKPPTPSKIAAIVKSLYTEKPTEKIIQDIDEIIMPHKKTKSGAMKRGQSQPRRQALTL